MSVASSAAAQPYGTARDRYATLGLDTSFLFGGGDRRGNVDLSYFVLMTPRAHWGLSEHATLSVGVGLPGLQLLALAGGKDGLPLAGAGPGINVPVEIRFAPAGRSHNGVILLAGTAPLFQTALPCIRGSDCSTGYTIAFGYSAQAGVGYQFRDGGFVNAAFSAGHLFVGSSEDTRASSGLFRGFWLGVGFAL